MFFSTLVFTSFFFFFSFSYFFSLGFVTASAIGLRPERAQCTNPLIRREW